MVKLTRSTVCSVALAFVLGSFLPASAQRRKDKDEDFTQTLEVVPDPPSFLTAETSRLVFHTVPMSSKGLLSQQVRDSLKALLKVAKRQQIVKLRAFVAGTGDMRRVQTIVSEELTEKRMTLPVLSVVQAGALPMAGAQVQIEATALERDVVNPHGIVFLSGQFADAEGPLRPRVLPLAERSLGQLRQVLQASGSTPEDLLRLSCFMSSIEDVQDVRAAALKMFPRAQSLFVQTQRAPYRTFVECEGIARLRQKPQQPVVFLNPDGMERSPMYAQAALISSPALVFAGSQLAFRYTEDDARLAFQRLDKTLEAAGTSLKRAVMMNTYPLSPVLTELVRKVRFEFLDEKRPPASTLAPFDGLPSMDGAFALEVVALPGSPGSSQNP